MSPKLKYSILGLFASIGVLLMVAIAYLYGAHLLPIILGALAVNT